MASTHNDNKFESIFKRACKRKGGEGEVRALLPQGILPPGELAALPDDRYLSGMSKAVFKAGFVWKVIDNKWPGFEKAFWQFNVRRCCAMSAEDIGVLCQNEAIVRNAKKIQSVQKNASMMLELAEEYGSFSRMIADWPDENFIGLTTLLHKRGDRLGLQTCQYFCRSMGKDGFVLSKDVFSALVVAKVLEKPSIGLRALARVQDAFNIWRKESGMRNAEISRVLALSVDS